MALPPDFLLSCKPILHLPWINSPSMIFLFVPPTMVSALHLCALCILCSLPCLACACGFGCTIKLSCLFSDCSASSLRVFHCTLILSNMWRSGRARARQWAERAAVILAPRPRRVFLLTLGGVPVLSQQLLQVCCCCWSSCSSSGIERSCSCPVLQVPLCSEHRGSLCRLVASVMFLTQLHQCHAKPRAFLVPELDPRCRVCRQLCASPGVKVLSLGGLLWDWVTAVQLQYYLLLWGFGLSWHFELHLEKVTSWLWMSEMFPVASVMGLAQVMPGLSGRALSPEIQRRFSPAVIPTTVMASFSFPVGITRVRLCWCALWSLLLCRGTFGARACGMPTSLPPSSGTPSPSMSRGWSTVLLTCTAIALTTSTSTPGRTPLSLWEPLVSAVALGTALQTQSDIPCCFTLVGALGTCSWTPLGARACRRLELVHPRGRLPCSTDGAHIERMPCSLWGETCSH